MRDFNKLLGETYRALDTARMLTDDSNRNGVKFVNTEQDLSRTLAERALASLSTGHFDKAKQSALAAKAAYRAVHRFLTKLVLGKERESIAVKLGKRTHLIEKLSAIK